MKIIRTIKDMQTFRHDHITKRIGFVPTMGYLHDGHTSLMTQAADDNDLVIASIFVNPLQFGPDEDYDQYPRDEKRDLNIAKKHGVDVLFLPNVKQMYPNNMAVQMTINDRVDVLCGRSRPGHFDGVLTVLTKLFNIIQPHQVYFGLKDAQQVAIVTALIQDLNFPMTLKGLPTVREQDGLAKSSRNVYLSPDEREEAVWLYRSLLHGIDLMSAGQKDAKIITQSVAQMITEHTKGTIDYVEILSFPQLKSMSRIDESAIIAVAVQYKQARLIDNVLLHPDGELIRMFEYKH